jgi:MinD-like ATPase involved in chromosome partitioning or flagellar assembly
MTDGEIRDRITANLENAGLDAGSIVVRPDPYGGWRLRIVAAGFEGRIWSERRILALNGLSDDDFQLIDLLTPEEAQSAEDLPVDLDVASLPLWPEAFARVVEHPTVSFASDLDADLEPPVVATFYSLRGGVGRSTALAYTARTLAARGRTVVCVDLDLEAPGLADLFGQEAESGKGVVDLLTRFDQGEAPDVTDHLLRISEADELYCLPAGRPDANYARRLRLLDPVAWYQEQGNPLADLLAAVRGLPLQPDAVLLDARTGISPLSAPLLFDFADLAVIGFYPHPQARVGTGNLVRALLNAKTWRAANGSTLTPEPRFLISPVPATRPEDRRRYEDRAAEWIAGWLDDAGVLGDGLPNMLDPSEITTVVSYSDVIALTDSTANDRVAWEPYEDLADWIDQLIASTPDNALEQATTVEKSEVLQGLTFSAGTAEDQENFLETFVSTERVSRALDEAVPLVIGRKGTGKTALFRRISEADDQPSVVVLAPSDLQGKYPGVLGSEGLKAVERRLESQQATWRTGWVALAAIAAWQKQGRPKAPEPIDKAIEPLPTDPDETAVVRCLEQLLAIDDPGLAMNGWLAALDRTAAPTTRLLFDGLDTGFGNTNDDRERRRRALEGLFTLLLDRSGQLQNLQFKVLLREDIWRNLRFDNKSHLFGRSIRLEWNDQADYVRTVLKQALQSAKFRLLASSSSLPSEDDISTWSEGEVFEAWNLLVGERMKGGKTAFTRNWVWNRLADGNEDRSPRSLLQLFRKARDWEIAESEASPYARSLIRPRALTQSLQDVSEEALDALREEFLELDPLIERLREIGRSPLNAEDVSSVSGEVETLALEVGLLEIYEGTEAEASRFRVPDLYRLALGMTRKGQA